MRILGLFTAAPYEDAVLGRLERRRGRWHGQLALPNGPVVPLRIDGGRSGPAEACLQLARELLARYADLRPAIAQALFEHYAPYVDAVTAGELDPVEGIPWLTRADEVWEHATLVRVSVEPLDRAHTVELAYQTAWDQEHTLGARFQEWRLVELNGSVL